MSEDCGLDGGADEEGWPAGPDPDVVGSGVRLTGPLGTGGGPSRGEVSRTNSNGTAAIAPNRTGQRMYFTVLLETSPFPGGDCFHDPSPQ